MPEINPVTKDQLFEKKIAENTGSNYNVGDISDVVPVTKDQALLKEIALNSAGQSGDITELEGKVADNTSAIEAIVNEYGAKNELPNNAVSDTVSGVTFTVNADKTITANGTATDDITFMLYDGVSLKLKDHLYSGCPLQTGVAIGAKFTTEGYKVVTTGATPEVALIDDIDKIYISIVNGTVVNNLVFKPMIRDARIKDPTYVRYSMTNEQLTERVNNIIGLGNVESYNSDLDNAPSGLFIVNNTALASNLPNTTNAAWVLFSNTGYDTVSGQMFGFQLIIGYNPSETYIRRLWSTWQPWIRLDNI